MSKSVKVLVYDKQNVGKHIKSTKRRFLWRFEVDGNQHQVDLYCSRLSGRRKLFFDGDIKHDTYSTGGLGSSYPVRYGKHIFLIVQQGDCDYDLRIDNISFKDLYSKQKGISPFDHLQHIKSMDDEWSNYTYDDSKTRQHEYRRSESEYVTTKTVIPRENNFEIKKKVPEQASRMSLNQGKINESKSLNSGRTQETKGGLGKSESMPEQIDLFDPNVSYRNAIPDDLFNPTPKTEPTENPFTHRNTFYDFGNQTNAVETESSLLDFNPAQGSSQTNGMGLQYREFSANSTVPSQQAQNPMMANQMMTNQMMTNPMMTNQMMTNQMMTNPMMANPMMTNPMMTNPIMSNPMMSNPMMAMNQYMTGMMMNQMMRSNPYMYPPS